MFNLFGIETRVTMVVTGPCCRLEWTQTDFLELHDHKIHMKQVFKSGIPYYVIYLRSIICIFSQTLNSFNILSIFFLLIRVFSGSYV